MNDRFDEKRLLLLGGSKPYVKIAKAAKRLGVHVIVVDKNATEEILSLCDEYLKLSLLDIRGITEWCEQNRIDGVINYCVDFAQRTYWELCNTFDLPCCYKKSQVDTLANKTEFKKLLVECGLDIVHSYSELDVQTDKVFYPIIIKPAESSGSRGASICYGKENAITAIEIAKAESRNGDIIIEDFIREAQEVQLTYFLTNGKIRLIRTADSYTGEKSDKLDRVVACAISPSRFTEHYLNDTHGAAMKMIEKLELQNGPFFMQGFYHDGKFKFFDPGCRFPGVDYDSIYIDEFGVDLAEYMVRFALSGKMPDNMISEDLYALHGKKAAVLFPVMKAGVINSISGLEELRANKSVFSVSQRHRVGDTVEFTYNVDQRFGEIDILASSLQELKVRIVEVQNTLSVKGLDGQEMIYSLFDVERIVQ